MRRCLDLLCHIGGQFTSRLSYKQHNLFLKSGAGAVATYEKGARHMSDPATLRAWDEQLKSLAKAVRDYGNLYESTLGERAKQLLADAGNPQQESQSTPHDEEWGY